MSYLPPDQEIAKPLDELLDKFPAVREAFLARLKSTEWNDSHIGQVSEALRLLLDLEVKLTMLLKGE